MKSKVYMESVDEIIVPSTAGKYRTYSVRVGEVCWNKNGDFSPAVYVVVKYNGVEQYDIPPHFLLEPDSEGHSDFEKVMQAMQILKKRHGLI